MRVARRRSVRAAPAEVWALVAPVEALPRWFSGVESAAHTGGPREGVGRRQRVSRSLYGHSLVVEQEVCTWEPERAIGWRHLREQVGDREVQGVRDFRTTLTLEPRPSGTRLSLEYRWTAPFGIAWLQSWLLGGRVMGKELRESLRNIDDAVKPARDDARSQRA